MKHYGLVGMPLGHSYSSIIHGMILHHFGILGSYQLLEMGEEALGPIIKEGKDGRFQGLNITITYKEGILHHLDKIDHRASIIGAVNTVSFRDGLATGYNTDYDGFLGLLQMEKIAVTGKPIAILGTGGSSKTVASVLKDCGAGAIYFVSRNPGGDSHISYDRLPHIEAELVINTTPIGMHPNIESTPITLEDLHTVDTVIDLIYNPKKTRLLKEAEFLGKRVIGGSLMLWIQALEASMIWNGLKVSTEEKKEILQKIAIHFNELK